MVAAEGVEEKEVAMVVEEREVASVGARVEAGRVANWVVKAAKGVTAETVARVADLEAARVVVMAVVVK
eukprot:6273501-Prymnesium_polylepis.1